MPREQFRTGTSTGARARGRHAITLAVAFSLGCEGLPLAAAPAPDEPTRAAVTPADWDVRPIFPDEAAVAAAREAVDASLRRFAAWQGALDQPATLAQALDARSELRTRISRLANHASVRLAHDGGDAVAAADADQASALSARASAAVAFIDATLAALGPTRLEALAADPALVRHGATLRRLAAQAAHVLPADQEALVAGAAPMQGAPATIRDVSIDVDGVWPDVELHGKSVHLDPGGFRRTLRDPDPDARRRAWEAFSAARDRIQRTQAALLSAYLAGQGWEARVRHWAHQADLIVAADPMPAGAFTALSSEARSAANGPLARFAALQSRLSGLSTLHSYDLSAPLVEDRRRFSIDDARAMTVAAVAPLGRAYQDRLARGLAQPLMDWHPQPTKGPGASTFYVSPDLPAYVAVSFRGEFDDVSAIAHEWGHWMHWDLSRSSGRPIESLVPPVTVGDVPSYLHELLLADRAIEIAPDRDGRIVALTHEIDLLRRSYYGIVAQASFDLALRAASDSGETLDADRISALYCESRHAYTPVAVQWEPRDCRGWVAEPYVYYDLYFYRYLLATSAAAAVAERVAGGEATIAERLLDFMSAGGAGDAAQLLGTLGIDPRDPETYRAMTRRMARLVEALEREVASR